MESINLSFDELLKKYQDYIKQKQGHSCITAGERYALRIIHKIFFKE